MDLDLEICSNEGSSTESLYNQRMTAINSMKEARSDKIRGTNQREGITIHSKPQVDRALASAFKYGIFDVRNYRYKIRDDILDDEDTIYWRAKKKRVRTPYRLQHDCRDYINPEKDGKKFRRFFVSDAGCSSKKGTKSNKGKGRTRQNTSKSDRKIPKKDVKKNSQWDEKRKNCHNAQNTRKKENRRFSAPKVRTSKDIVPTQRKIKKITTKKNVKEAFCNCSHTDEDSEMASECDCKCKCYTTKSRSNRGYHQSNHAEFIEELVSLENASKTTSTSSRTNSDLNMSSFTNLQPGTNNVFSNTTIKQSGHSLECALSYSQGAYNLIDEWFEKLNWTVNRSQLTQGTIKQFDNGLKIEPIDSSPFKNLQDTSYIS